MLTRTSLRLAQSLRSAPLPVSAAPRAILPIACVRPFHQRPFTQQPQQYPDKNSRLTESMGSVKDSSLLEIIKKDHDSFTNLFERYCAATSQEQKKQLTNEFIREVCQHSIAEELLVYPSIERLNITGQGKEIADHLRHEHYEVKVLLSQLDKMDVVDLEHGALMKKIANMLQHHAREEEGRDVPLLMEKLDSNELVTMTERFNSLKAIAPTRPHPSAPDKWPILEMLAGISVYPIDKFRDTIRNFAEREVV